MNIEPKYMLDYATEIAFRSDTRRLPNGQQLKLALNLAMTVGESEYWKGFTRGHHRTGSHKPTCVPFASFGGSPTTHITPYSLKKYQLQLWNPSEQRFSCPELAIGGCICDVYHESSTGIGSRTWD
jgi:hypothetical protein